MERIGGRRQEQTAGLSISHFPFVISHFCIAPLQAKVRSNDSNVVPNGRMKNKK
jgi:hypothetical protein